eukprot:40642_1
MEDEEQNIVIDNGSGMVKAGFGGEDAPRVVIPCIVGTPRRKQVMVGMRTVPDYYIGDESATCRRGALSYLYPIQHGIVTNWQAMERYWHHIFYNELRIAPQEHNVLHTEIPLNSKSDRETLTQIMFETFQVPKLYISIAGVLALYAAGRTTGIVLDIGHTQTHTIPIKDGYYISDAVRKLNMGGKDITEYLMQLLKKRGYYLTTMAEQEIVRDIKEKLSYVENYQENILCESEKKYELPDGQIITVGYERYQAPEMLFDPNLSKQELLHPDINDIQVKKLFVDGYIRKYNSGLLHEGVMDLLERFTCKYSHIDGVHDMLLKSIMKCNDINFRKQLFENIVICGGSSMFSNLEIRLENEMKRLDLENNVIQVIAQQERKYSAWIGGSILISLPSFNEMWITNTEYDQVGPSIVYRKAPN